MAEDTKKMSPRRLAQYHEDLDAGEKSFDVADVARLLAHIEALEDERDEARREIVESHIWAEWASPSSGQAVEAASERGWGYLYPEESGS